MKDEIYVGKLISDKYLSHSAKGSTWKDHKYIKKIGNIYRYPKEYYAKYKRLKEESSDLREESKHYDHLSNVSDLQAQNYYQQYQDYTDESTKNDEEYRRIQEDNLRYNRLVSKDPGGAEHWDLRPYVKGLRLQKAANDAHDKYVTNKLIGNKSRAKTNADNSLRMHKSRAYQAAEYAQKASKAREESDSKKKEYESMAIHKVYKLADGGKQFIGKLRKRKKN